MDLRQNPFFVLGATTRDDRRRIVELAEEKSLLSDEERVREARSTLTNPMKRLAAEVAWLPGMGPKRVAEALSLISSNPVEIRGRRSLPPLARANLLADGLLRAVEKLDADSVAQWVVELAQVYNGLDVESIMTVLNEERAVAGFPNLSDAQPIETELENRRQYYKRAIKDALDKLPTETLMDVITRAVDSATAGGESHAPILIDDLVDSFEVEAQSFFEKETGNIESLVRQIKSAAQSKKGEVAVTQLVAKLEQVVKNWDKVAQPIQLSTRSRGLEHALSHDVAAEIRGLAVELFNEYGLLEISQRLTTLRQEVFAEVDKVIEQTEEDSLALEEIAEQRTRLLEEMEVQADAWKEEITYEADLGLVFKDKLRISPDGVEWKGRRIPLESITTVNWGGTRHSVNGIPTGTTYSIGIGSEGDGVYIELKKQRVYAEFIERLWKSVGPRLLTEMLEGLRDGKRYQFGSAIMDDYGIELERRHLFSSNERVHCKWTDLVIGNGAGTFYFAKKDEKKVSAELSYQDVDNVHVLETGMRIFWKRATSRFSELLSDSG